MLSVCFFTLSFSHVWWGRRGGKRGTQGRPSQAPRHHQTLRGGWGGRKVHDLWLPPRGGSCLSRKDCCICFHRGKAAVDHRSIPCLCRVTLASRSVRACHFGKGSPGLLAWFGPAVAGPCSRPGGVIGSLARPVLPIGPLIGLGRGASAAFL